MRRPATAEERSPPGADASSPVRRRARAADRPRRPRRRASAAGGREVRRVSSTSFGGRRLDGHREHDRDHVQDDRDRQPQPVADDGRPAQDGDHQDPGDRHAERRRRHEPGRDRELRPREEVRVLRLLRDHRPATIAAANPGRTRRSRPVTCRNRNSRNTVSWSIDASYPRAAARARAPRTLRHAPRPPLDEVDEDVLAEVLGLRVERPAPVELGHRPTKSVSAGVRSSMNVLIVIPSFVQRTTSRSVSWIVRRVGG